MRTTINIRDDLMIKLKETARKRNQNLTSLVNELLQNSLSPAESFREPFRQKTFALGERPGINFHKSLDLAAEMETDYTIGKMELDK